jgi:alpha-D-xyloside xylohydrolase
MTLFRTENHRLIWTKYRETLWIEPWGINGLRVRATILPEMPEMDWALLPPSKTDSRIEISDDFATITNGLIKARVASDGRISFHKTSDNSIFLEEVQPSILRPSNRFYRQAEGDLYHTEVRFKSYDGERIYGLGQHRNGYLDQKGCVIDLVQKNTEVTIPWLLSNRMYGVLWNNPGIGQIQPVNNHTCWINYGTKLIDYYITSGDSYFDLMERYADATGHPPMIPEWATGFWQSKCRYLNQDELMKVAREHKKRNLPISVIVIDFMHWTQFGDWKFNTDEWPDPDGMVRELDKMGIKAMVSIWPTVNRNSENYREMFEKGFLLETERGMNLLHCMPDNPGLINQYLHFYDPTIPEAREYLWNKVKKGYYDKGIKIFWLDACEPEVFPVDFDHVRYRIGNGLEVGCIYPYYHQMGFYEGMKNAGENEILTLCRSAWAGSQRFGASVWSGDIESTFESLQEQVPAGLNMAMSGIPWWNTDIGGFMHGDINSDYFRDLIVKWFQYAVFTPIFRLHGYRKPSGYHAGAENEVWSFGDEAYAKIKECLCLREKLRPYLMEQMKLAHLKGTPVIRPLFFDFPHDKTCYEIKDQFMFGTDYMVAPILEEGKNKREVYLPEGSKWQAMNGGLYFSKS